MISIEKFLNSLPIMGKGFLGIFIILGIIIIATVFLNAVTKKGEKNKKTILACVAALLVVVITALAYGFFM